MTWNLICGLLTNDIKIRHEKKYRRNWWWLHRSKQLLLTLNHFVWSWCKWVFHSDQWDFPSFFYVAALLWVKIEILFIIKLAMRKYWMNSDVFDIFMNIVIFSVFCWTMCQEEKKVYDFKIIEIISLWRKWHVAIENKCIKYRW